MSFLCLADKGGTVLIDYQSIRIGLHIEVSAKVTTIVRGLGNEFASILNLKLCHSSSSLRTERTMGCSKVERIPLVYNEQGDLELKKFLRSGRLVKLEYAIIDIRDVFWTGIRKFKPGMWRVQKKVNPI